MLNRRTLLSAGMLAGLAPGIVWPAATPRVRRIPASSETIPVIGLGTSRTFDVGADTAARDALLPTLREFFAQGGKVIDSSPMYGSAEAVTGYLLPRLAPGTTPFIKLDLTSCENCGGQVRVIACLEDPAVISRILAHLDRPAPPSVSPILLPPDRSRPGRPARVTVCGARNCTEA